MRRGLSPSLLDPKVEEGTVSPGIRAASSSCQGKGQPLLELPEGKAVLTAPSYQLSETQVRLLTSRTVN